MVPVLTMLVASEEPGTFMRGTGTMPFVLVIVGPTGSGKSKLAVQFARKFKGELVSADSRQIYKGMDVATAKLKPPKGVKQWLTDVTAPNKPVTLAEYQEKAIKAIKDIHGQGKLPILVGGTGLYVDAVLENWIIPKVKPNPAFRRRIEKELAANGVRYLAALLKRLDPSGAKKIDLKNPRRVIRALEIIESLGVTLERRKGQPQFDSVIVGLRVSPSDLQKKIRARTKKMIADGLLSETKRLLKHYDPSLPAMSGIGYPEAVRYLKGEISKKELEDGIVLRTTQYAKRQMTWFKRNKKIIWVSV